MIKTYNKREQILDPDCLFDEYECASCGGNGAILVNEWDTWRNGEQIQCECCEGTGTLYLEKNPPDESK